MLADRLRWVRWWQRAGYTNAPWATVEGTWPTVRYEFDCPRGWTRSALDVAAEKVALAARVEWWELCPTAGGHWSLLLDASDWRTTAPPPLRRLDGCFQVPVGVYPDELAVWHPLLAPHLLIAGATGSGKSSLLRTIAAGLPLGWCWRVVIIDPKELDFAPARHEVEVRTLAEAPEVLAGLAAALTARKARIAHQGGDHWTALNPRVIPERPVVVIIDEAADVFGGTGLSKADGTAVRESAGVLIRQGRACGFHVVAAFTRPDTEAIPGGLRDQFGGRIALGAMSLDGARMMFGHAATHVPAVTLPGVGLSLGLDGTQRLRRFRTPFTVIDDVRRRHGVPPAGTVTSGRSAPPDCPGPTDR